MTTTLAAAYVDDKVSQQLPTAENNSFETRNMPFHNVEPAKNVVVYLNGDRFYPGRKFIVSKKQLHDFDGFLNEVTRGIKPSFGAVRNIYTPSQGHKVFGLDQIENNMTLVAGGIERFRSIGYRDITLRPNMKHTTKKVSMERIPPKNKLQVPGRYRTITNEPVQIFIHANGDILAPAAKILLTPRQMKNWDLILQLITEKISNRTGKAVRKLYNTSYQMLYEPAALENGQSYIAVGSEKLKRLPYGTVGGNRSLRQISPRRPNVPLPPIKPKPKTTKKIKRRSKPKEQVVMKESAATGYAPLVTTGKPKPPPVPKPEIKEEDSVFHAKPVLVKKQPPPDEAILQQEDEDSNQGVFRAEVAHVVAEEIKEDENTKVDVPIDQLPAEKVEEEIVVEASIHESVTESVVETTQQNEKVEETVEKTVEKQRARLSYISEQSSSDSESSETKQSSSSSKSSTEQDTKFSFAMKKIMDFSPRSGRFECVKPAAKTRFLAKRKCKKKETFVKKPGNFKKETFVKKPDNLKKETFVKKPDNFKKETFVKNSENFKKETFVKNSENFKKETFVKKPENFKKVSLAVVKDSLDFSSNKIEERNLNPWSRSYEFEDNNLDSLSDS